MLLTKGRYGFEGKVRTEGVEPLALGKNQGASLRVVGVPAGKTDRMLGREDWKTLRVEFDIAAEAREVGDVAGDQHAILFDTELEHVGIRPSELAAVARTSGVVAVIVSDGDDPG